MTIHARNAIAWVFYQPLRVAQGFTTQLMSTLAYMAWRAPLAPSISGLSHHSSESYKGSQLRQIYPAQKSRQSLKEDPSLVIALTPLALLQSHASKLEATSKEYLEIGLGRNLSCYHPIRKNQLREMEGNGKLRVQEAGSSRKKCAAVEAMLMMYIALRESLKIG